jgi:hypothetical protein
VEVGVLSALSPQGLLFFVSKLSYSEPATTDRGFTIQRIGELVVDWVAISESSLLYVFVFALFILVLGLLGRSRGSESIRYSGGARLSYFTSCGGPLERN